MLIYKKKKRILARTAATTTILASTNPHDDGDDEGQTNNNNHKTMTRDVNDAEYWKKGQGYVFYFIWLLMLIYKKKECSYGTHYRPSASVCVSWWRRRAPFFFFSFLI